MKLSILVLFLFIWTIKFCAILIIANLMYNCIEKSLDCPFMEAKHKQEEVKKLKMSKTSLIILSIIDFIIVLVLSFLLYSFLS